MCVIRTLDHRKDNANIPSKCNVTNVYISVNVFGYRLSLNNNVPNEKSGFKKTGRYISIYLVALKYWECLQQFSL